MTASTTQGIKTVLHPVSDLAAAKAVSPALRYEIEGSPASQATIAPLDISAAKRHLGWEPKLTLRSAFEDYLKELKAARG